MKNRTPNGRDRALEPQKVVCSRDIGPWPHRSSPDRCYIVGLEEVGTDSRGLATRIRRDSDGSNSQTGTKAFVIIQGPTQPRLADTCCPWNEAVSMFKLKISNCQSQSVTLLPFSLIASFVISPAFHLLPLSSEILLAICLIYFITRSYLIISLPSSTLFSQSPSLTYTRREITSMSRHSLTLS